MWNFVILSLAKESEFLGKIDTFKRKSLILRFFCCVQNDKKQCFFSRYGIVEFIIINYLNY